MWYLSLGVLCLAAMFIIKYIKLYGGNNCERVHYMVCGGGGRRRVGCTRVELAQSIQITPFDLRARVRISCTEAVGGTGGVVVNALVVTPSYAF